MAGMQVRISEATHQLLRSLASQAGESMQEVVEKAVEHYRRKAFLEGLNDDFRNLRENQAAWQDEEEERGLWDNTLQDGLEKE
ncbi:MAG: type II toxin-antitoxin system VapB family antitoxin [Acidobacteriota bacterium]|nr:type II toxin-antitoxin system VapB family antitoxin [Acidobacteriota bacterium]